ncbi:MAG: tRNA pseudouridine(13) synthase TruD [Gammaproteobacteria bacterium]
MFEREPSIARSELDDALDLPYAYGGPVGSARFKQLYEDFFVEESLGFECSGEGEHLFLKIEKRGCNTEEVAARLARFAGVPRREVSFAGLKDKNAITQQWFSIRLPKIADYEWERCGDENLVVLARQRHARKLRRGALAANRFSIRLRDLDAKPDRLEAVLARISGSGVPNYFGPQRFGYAGRNLADARRFFDRELRAGPQKRAMLLSAARSFLFNRILACRVEERTWDRTIAGDALMFDASKAYFTIGIPSDSDQARVAARELHPSGTLWGLGETGVRLDALALETGILQHYPALCRGLEQAGVESGRRALRLLPRQLSWRFEAPRDLLLDFALPAGGYATSVLRELLDCTE